MALVNQNKTSNWTAASAVNVQNGTGEAVMYMNAAYDGRICNFGQNIQNMELYQANKATVDKDFEDFKAGVLEDIGE